jgi:1-acyl-sn-glycerol-3-phosphate acyltransferase
VKRVATTSEQTETISYDPAGGRPVGWSFSGPVRGSLVLGAFLGLTVPLMPVQAVLKRVRPAWARTFPHWYHKRVCRLLGIHVRVAGEFVADRPVLIVANHTSWLDIPVLSAVAPVSFVAKSEVDGWPGVGALARLQRTVFVNRTRRSDTGRTAGEIAQRLAAGDNVVLFAEGTSSDGNRVFPFRSSLFAAAVPANTPAEAASGAASPVLQTASVVYTHVHGVPLSRADRPLIGWYGDMDMVPHGWGVLKAGPIDVTVALGPPMALNPASDRKQLARSTEADVRARVTALLRDPSP